ncbi:hypothetical protein OIU76_023237, partial [Salix suchowensis]
MQISFPSASPQIFSFHYIQPKVSVLP